mgnify:CR=1 FL=1
MNYNKADFIASYGISSQLPESDRPELSFSGRSNVGKSSLINKLCNRKNLARVSSTPGKTATINFYTVGGVYLVDLPGYGYAKVSKNEKKRWAELVEGYFAQERNIKLIIQILDMRHPPTDDDLEMVDFLYRSNYPFAVVLTKRDKLNKTNQKLQLEYYQDIFSTIEDLPMIEFSAQDGYGKEEIKALIESHILQTE